MSIRTRNIARILAAHSLPVRFRAGRLFTLDITTIRSKWIAAPATVAEAYAWLGY